jgi:ferrous iron transport protein B
MGLDWRMMVALLTSFVAKENSIATLGVLYGAGEQATLAERLAETVSWQAALSFLVVQMLFIPCAATLAVVWQETKSRWWTLFDVAFLLLVSLGTGTLVYQVFT